MGLAQAGFKVEALCPEPHPIDKVHSVGRRYTYRALRPLRSLVRAISASNPELVLPGDDLATEHLHNLYIRREAYFDYPAKFASLIERSLGSSKYFPMAHSRAAFMELAREAGVRVPDTGVMTCTQDVENWIKRYGLPAVLKADGTSGGEGVRVVHTSVEAERAFRKLQAPQLLARAIKRALIDQNSTLILPSLLRQRPTVSAQTFVSGHEATSTVVCWNGAVLASLHFEVLGKSYAAGQATVVRRLDNTEMQAAIEKIAQRMKLSGVCGFDFMIEANTGNAYLIEINPRATQVGHISLGAGRDLPAALYAAVSERPIQLAPIATDNDTIALFPQEWARDPESAFLRTAHHDVPWDAPELVSHCVRRRRKQRVWPFGSDTARDNEVASLPGRSVAKRPAPTRVHSR